MISYRRAELLKKRKHMVGVRKKLKRLGLWSEGESMAQQFALRVTPGLDGRRILRPFNPIGHRTFINSLGRLPINCQLED